MVTCQPLDQDDRFAPLLADTGCLDGSSPAPGLVPYSVRSPLWTDGALKERWISLPVDSVIGYAPDAPWVFPEDAVLIKSFLRGPSDPIETRLMVRRGTGWRFASYRWEEGSAQLLEDALQESVTLADGTLSEWYFPAPDGCLTCHAGGAIGPIAPQLHTEYDYEGAIRSQLDEMARVGLFDVSDPTPPEPLAVPADAAAPMQDRARSWMHGNCSHCHRPGGWAPPEMDMDLRARIPLSAARICGVPVQFETAPEAGAWRLAPGDPTDSALLGRIEAVGIMRMPPVGVSRVDPLGAELLATWIDGRQDCAEE